MYKDYSYYLNMAEQMATLDEFEQNELLNIIKTKEKTIDKLKKVNLSVKIRVKLLKQMKKIEQAEIKLIESNYLTAFKLVPFDYDDTGNYGLLFHFAVEGLIEAIETFKDENYQLNRYIKHKVFDKVYDGLDKRSSFGFMSKINEQLFFS